jgi:hypothetical protein
MTEPRRLLISFSGGETSAFMTWWLLKHAADQWDEIAIVFANTSEENEETLAFTDRCDRELFAPLGHRVVYIEGVQQHGVRKAPIPRIVTFETAARDGSVFEDFIRKYGIPNQKFKSCTRSLKRKPIEQYAKLHLGWPLNSYDVAIGIRADEIDRMSEDRDNRRIIYPLIQMIKRTKPQINTWWEAQPFRLGLKGYQGNCKWCWKKSLRKHLTLIDEAPHIYDFPRRMEEEWGGFGPEFLKDPATRRDPLPPGYRRVFFRDNRSVEDLFEELERRKAAGTFVPAEDDAVVYDVELDAPGGCGDESCEVFTDASEDDEDEEEMAE